MARLPELCAALAKVDGRDAAAIGRIARVVREAGLITTTKRGVGAADMTAADAANLIIALEGCEAAKDAVAAVRRFRAAKRLRFKSSPTLKFEPYRSIDAATNFGEALEMSIDAVPAIIAEIAGVICAVAGDDTKLFLRILFAGTTIPADQLVISFSPTMASIERLKIGNPESDQIRFRFLTHDDAPVAMPGVDRNITVRIGLPTLIRVWRTLHGEEAYKTVCDAAAAAANQLTSVGED